MVGGGAAVVVRVVGGTVVDDEVDGAGVEDALDDGAVGSALGAELDGAGSDPFRTSTSCGWPVAAWRERNRATSVVDDDVTARASCERPLTALSTLKVIR